jgi:hypothetical protein
MTNSKFSYRAVIMIALLILFCADALAQSKPLELKWDELDSLIAGEMVQMILPDGTAIKGEAIAVREDALLMDIKRTSDSGIHPKGNALIARNSVSLIRLERNGGSWGKNLGTVIGVLTGVVVGGYIAGTSTDSAEIGIPTFLGIASGVSVGGYLVGRETDKQTTYIKIVP